MNKLKVLSLFSGIGAFEKALTNLGVDYKLVGFSEIDKWAIQSYCAIHDVGEEINLGDVSEIGEQELPNADLITYGFPCQDISTAGKGKGIRVGTRSGLLYEAERIIAHTKPKYAVAENVKNLVGKRYKEDFKALLGRLEGYGYNNYWKVLNAKDFGVPQNRERVFIVSIRKDIDEESFEFPKGLDNTIVLRDYLVKKVDDKYYLRQEQVDRIFSSTFNQANKRIQNQESQIATLLARDFKDPKCVMEEALKHQKSEKTTVRKVTPWEYYRLMGFDDEDYWVARRRLEEVFYNGADRSDSQMYKQAGNSIVINVLENIFKKLLL